VKCEDGIVPEGIWYTIAVERCSRERASVDAVSDEPNTALKFQAVEQVEDGAAVRVLPIEFAGFLYCE
jgi:hypothetical protein